MASKHVGKRRKNTTIAGVAVMAVGAAGLLGVAAAAPLYAAAPGVTVSAITAGPIDGTGWFMDAGTNPGVGTWSLKADGLHYGTGGFNRFINQVTAPASNGVPVTGPQLTRLLNGFGVDLTADSEATTGAAQPLVGLTVVDDGGVAHRTTLYTAPSTIASAGYEDDYQFKVQPFTDGYTPEFDITGWKDLSVLDNLLDDEGDLYYRSFGILGNYPSLVKSVTWNGSKTTFSTVTPPTPTPKPTPTSSPDPTKPPAPADKPKNTIEKASVTAGAKFTVTGTGFLPNEDVKVFLHSDPILLGTVTADEHGVLNGQVTIPNTAPAGTHHIVLQDIGGAVFTSADITITSGPMDGNGSDDVTDNGTDDGAAVGASNGAPAAGPDTEESGLDEHPDTGFNPLLPAGLSLALLLGGLSAIFAGRARRGYTN
ncbi:hypothetical protein [Leifsonia sp. Leaf264]|uniref:hypothetical protein n=1 Tax=Leifsonia sp. Leaf264 TaxID=1736314 RepID=UPI0006F3FC11|nr:hypothetical protein [Leifsonia sp. Leaf264]KQO98728.1 hypothetical protein ASF30_11745 [Leifsonia sp. Leaf264]